MFGLDNVDVAVGAVRRLLDMLLHGDLGVSISTGMAPVGDVIAAALPWTLGLVGFATIISFLDRNDPRRDRRLAARRPPGCARPGDDLLRHRALLLARADLHRGLLDDCSAGSPPATRTSWAWNRAGTRSSSSQVISHAALPAITIVIASIGGWVLGMRNMMLTVLDEDYITVAQAKGMPNRRVLWRYAARNAVLPQIQSFALAIGFIVGGTIVMEMVFSYPGIGLLLLNATNAKDYALMQGIFLVLVLAVLVANILGGHRLRHPRSPRPRRRRPEHEAPAEEAVDAGAARRRRRTRDRGRRSPPTSRRPKKATFWSSAEGVARDVRNPKSRDRTHHPGHLRARRDLRAVDRSVRPDGAEPGRDPPAAVVGAPARHDPHRRGRLQPARLRNPRRARRRVPRDDHGHGRRDRGRGDRRLPARLEERIAVGVLERLPRHPRRCR